jgi:hypothetical protein
LQFSINGDIWDDSRLPMRRKIHQDLKFAAGQPKPLYAAFSITPSTLSLRELEAPHSALLPALICLRRSRPVPFQ